jgi:uncharacterized damage-inducible protein DinB
LYHYHVWANDRLFNTAAKLSAEQWLAPSHATFGSLRDVMTHIVNCERGWMSYVQGYPEPGLSAADFGSAAELRECWDAINAHTNRCIDSLSDEALAQVVPCRDPFGETHDYPLWKLLLHQANHAMQHRSEAALVMSALGASTDWMDYFIFVNQVERPWLQGTPKRRSSWEGRPIHNWGA